MPEPTLVGLLDRAARLWTEQTAWTFDRGAEGTTHLTFGEIEAETRRLASALAARGVGPGDRVGVMLGNHVEFPLVWFALMRLGAAMVPLNVRYRATDAGHVLEDAGCRLAVAWPEHAEVLAAVEVITPADLAEHRHLEHPAVAVGPDAVVNLQYTSGTTGRPKGCVLTHTYWTTLAGSLVEEFPRIRPDDVLLTAQPFHYIDPQWNLVTALLAGARVVVLDGFHPSTFWDAVRRHEVTYFYCLASMPALLYAMPPSERDLDHRVRAIQCSAIPPALHADLERRWGVPWFEAFGMTETGADIRVGEEEHDELVGSGCLGRPAAHRRIRLDDAGQLWLRGPGMMEGYLGLPSPFDTDGWFPTGDLARIDDHGRVYLVGRLKDMIRRSGENIAAQEVEEVLLAHPAVRLAAVIGVPDELRGEEVMAVVVAPEADEADLRAWCADRLAPFKVPSRWQFRDDLPLTASQRVEKATVRAEVLGGRA
ncbi:ATP-dependent acyl-CoA ligase [Nocardioides fonticola]|uniref:ATP-dependent acyl-CoA ligase n=1 Tax=Nocardioides fonticola TaxID=450363 RepID=A0ABP7XUQ8_9ACTN